MAAGVGKTYRMLQEGHAELEAGRDVVIGYLEPHGRAETEPVAAGSRCSPGAGVDLPDSRSPRWTCPACSLRAPELALIDELAHTNAPGAEHAKRYEDVADVLAAGIDVFSTVNVQHLESLNDQVAELTGVRVRETFPDAVLSGADEVVLVDVTPRGADRAAAGGQGLQARARAGRAERLLPGREPRRAARGRAAPGRRGRRGQAARARAAPVRDEHRVLGQAGPRRSASGCSRSSRRRRPRSASCGAPGARPSGSARSSTCSPSCRPGREPAGEVAEQLDALRRLGSLLGVDRPRRGGRRRRRRRSRGSRASAGRRTS